MPCSRTQLSVSVEAQTSDASITSQALSKDVIRCAFEPL